MGGHFLQIVTGTKDASHPFEDNDPRLGVLGGGVKGLLQPRNHLKAQGIASGGMVEGQVQDPVLIHLRQEHGVREKRGLVHGQRVTQLCAPAKPGVGDGGPVVTAETVPV